MKFYKTFVCKNCNIAATSVEKPVCPKCNNMMFIAHGEASTMLFGPVMDIKVPQKTGVQIAKTPEPEDYIRKQLAQGKKQKSRKKQRESR